VDSAGAAGEAYLGAAGVQPAVTAAAEPSPGSLRESEVEVRARPAIDGEQDRAALAGFRGQPLPVGRPQPLAAGKRNQVDPVQSLASSPLLVPCRISGFDASRLGGCAQGQAPGRS
jgi:hypothetical protein